MRWIVVVAAVLAGAAVAQDEPTAANSCVDCHRRPETVRAFPNHRQDEFLHWYGSVHGRHQVTCEQCHGGDPLAAEKETAHRQVLPAADPKSSTYYKNLPATCGSCHDEVARQFSHSEHFARLEADELAPTCTTCHGFDMDIPTVDPDRIAERCAICHNERQNIHPEITAAVRRAVAQIATAKKEIRQAKAAQALAAELGRKSEKAGALLQESEQRLAATGSLWHQFELAAFAGELRKVIDLARRAYASSREALVSR